MHPSESQIDAGFFTDMYLEADDQVRNAEVDEQVGFLISALDLVGGARILDLGCGVGRHSIALAEQGYEVIGVDSNSEYLARAERIAPKSLNLSFVRCDMREVAGAVDRDSFDAVISMHTSFGLFSEAEDLRVLSQIHDVLQPGGHVLLDVTNRDWFLQYWGPTEFAESGETFVVRDYEWVDDVVFLHEESFDPNTSQLCWQISKVGTSDEEVIITNYRLYSLHEVVALFTGAGLAVTARYGNYDGSRFQLHSPRIACVAQRPVQCPQSDKALL